MVAGCGTRPIRFRPRGSRARNAAPGAAGGLAGPAGRYRAERRRWPPAARDVRLGVHLGAPELAHAHRRLHVRCDETRRGSRAALASHRRDARFHRPDRGARSREFQDEDAARHRGHPGLRQHPRAPRGDRHHQPHAHRRAQRDVPRRIRNRAHAGLLPRADGAGSPRPAAAATVGASIVTAQPPANGVFETVFRFFSPLSGGGFEGVLGQSAFAGRGGVVLDAAGRLVQIQDATVGTFLAGPGQVPPGYSPATYSGAVTFRGGDHHDAFRSPDGSVILGRWAGGTVGVSDSSGGRTFDLGPRSVSYDVTTPTVAGVLGSFTGSSTYNLAAATAPTDSAGNTGSVTSAVINANFSARTINGNFGLAINGRSFSLTGVSDLAPGSPQFAFASGLLNLNIACARDCATQGYLGTMNGQFAGAAGQWITVSYRVNPVRTPGSGFSDYVVGNIALTSNLAPTIGIVLPQSGTASLSFTAADPARSVSNYAQASGPPTISGTVQANFTSQTASFTATVSGGCGCSAPTFTASASNLPIVGAGFSASTDAQRPGAVGPMTVAGSGTACGCPGSRFGRFDGLFRNSAATSGIATLIVGDNAGGYDVTAGFGSANLSRAALVAADGRNAIGRLTNASPGAMAVTANHGANAITRFRLH